MRNTIDGITYHPAEDPWIYSVNSYRSANFVREFDPPMYDHDGNIWRIPGRNKRQNYSYHLKWVPEWEDFLPYEFFHDEDSWEKSKITPLSKEAFFKTIPDDWRKHCSIRDYFEERVEKWMEREKP